MCGLNPNAVNMNFMKFQQVHNCCFRLQVSSRQLQHVVHRQLACSAVFRDKAERPAELDDFPGREFTSAAGRITVKGKIYDNKPFKFSCVKNKMYKWCACGLSKNQPFCDGSHNGPLARSILRPVKFIAPETKDYWFCNCKQTDHRPLCDGTHKDPKIQAAVRS